MLQPGDTGNTDPASREDSPAWVPSRQAPIAFVITLWLEPLAQPGWRWRVTRVPTGERRYFRRLADLLAYVSAEAGAPPPE